VVDKIGVTQVLINSLSGACLYLLIGVSFWLIYAPTKTFFVSHAAAITFGAYACYWFNQYFGLPLPTAVCLAAIAVALGFAAVENALFQSLRGDSKSWVGLVASIGLYVVLQNIISLGFGDDTLVLRQGTITVGQKIGHAYVTWVQTLMIIVGGVLFVSTIMLLSTTRLGRGIRGVASNPDLCVLLGLNVDRITLWSIGMGSALAAVAGILSALDSDMTPTMGFRLLLNGVIVMIIAGAGSIRGFAWAALLLSMAQHLAAYFLDAKWMDTVAFIILIGFLIWKPLGFAEQRLKKVEL